MPSFLIEPMALLHGEAARMAIGQRAALTLQGGSSAFALAGLIGAGETRIVPVALIPPEWHAALDHVTRPPDPAGLPLGPMVMGILNVTPDSFSDGGRHLHVTDAIAAGHGMIRAGAAILDIGGESTRPDATVVDPAQEIARIVPVVVGLRGQGALLSIDTRNAMTMQAALEAGADLINDVSGLMHDPAAPALLLNHDCPVVLMHMRGTPASMGGFTQYDDVAVDTVRELSLRIEAAVQAGIARSRLVIDPGIGFAKNEAQSLELLRRLPIFANLGCRIMLGTSRKRFIGRIAGVASAGARDPGSMVSSLPGLALPGCILRVHDVPGMVQALRVWQAIQG